MTIPNFYVKNLFFWVIFTLKRFYLHLNEFILILFNVVVLL